MVDKYVDIVSVSVNPAETRGFALALGSLPSKLLAPSLSVLSSVLDCLCDAARYDSRVGKDADAETRRNAVLSLARVCETVGAGSVDENSSGAPLYPAVTLTPQMVGKVYESFLLALEDYNVDRRGDVGSWSRVAAMSGLEHLTYAVVASDGCASTRFNESMCVRVFGGLLKQFSEKLDSVRSHAGGCLSRMLTCTSPAISVVPGKDALIDSLQLNPLAGGSLKSTNWANPVITYRLAMASADVDEFFSYVLSGIIISVGGLGESVSQYSEDALLVWIREKPPVGAPDRPTRVANGKEWKNTQGLVFPQTPHHIAYVALCHQSLFACFDATNESVESSCHSLRLSRSSSIVDASTSSSMCPSLRSVFLSYHA